MSSDGPRAKTVEEMRHEFLEHISCIGRYWLMESRAQTPREKIDGVIFSILVMLDGGSTDTPAFDIIPSPHEDDEAWRRGNGQNWWAKEVINDTELHEMWNRYSLKRKV